MTRYVLLGLTALALVCPAPAAPLPAGAREQMHFKRSLGPQDLAGDWLMTWGGTEWRVALDAGGGYRCTPAGERSGSGTLHVGSWSLDSQGDLVITEGLCQAGVVPPEVFFSWTARLRRDARGRLDVRDLAGEVDARGAFRLRRL